MIELQQLFIRNLRSQRKRLRLTQEQAAERAGVTHSFYAAIEGGAKFPSIQKIQDIGKGFGIPPYRLFIDQPEIGEMQPVELLDRFAEFLVRGYQKEVTAAKKEFLKRLETQKKTGKNTLGDDEPL